MSRLTLLYKKVHGLVDVDPSKVVNSGRVTRRSTSQHRFRNIMANKNCYRSSFFSWTVHKWNNLPDHLCSCHSVETFRTQLAQEIDITALIPGGGGGGVAVLGSGFAGYVPLASQNPHPIIVYSVVIYRSHLNHFWANVIVISRTEFNASRLLNIKTTAGTIFQSRIFLFLNPCLPEFFFSQKSRKFATPF